MTTVDKRGTLYEKCIGEFGMTPNQVRDALDLDARELRQVWDYRSIGLKVDAARMRLRACLGEYKWRPNPGRGAVRWTTSPPPRSPRIEEHIRRRRQEADIRASRAAIERTLAAMPTAKTAYDPDDMLRGWNHGFQCKILCQDGLVLTLKREEDVQWVKSSYHWPKKQVKYRATLYNRDFRIIKSSDFNRRGRWLQKICRAWSLRPDLVSKGKVQKSAGLFDPRDEKAVSFRDDVYTVIRVKDAATAMRISRGTCWCTKHRNHAKNYTKSDDRLFCVYKDGMTHALAWLPASPYEDEEEEIRDIFNQDIVLPRHILDR